jgi:hypothetical protein
MYLDNTFYLRAIFGIPPLTLTKEKNKKLMILGLILNRKLLNWGAL